MPNTNTQTSVIQSKIELTKNVVEFRLNKPDNFEYTAGQFVQILIPHGESALRRSYSISSAPEDPYIEFCIKIIPDGIGTQYLNQRIVGDTLTYSIPLGRFTNTNTNTPLVFIATGVGLSPMMSILESELKYKKNQSLIDLIFGVRDESDIFWLERLETLARDYPNFHYTLTLSQPTPTWDAARGRVTMHIPTDCATQKFFVCGNTTMIVEVRKMLLERGAQPANIHIEVF